MAGQRVAVNLTGVPITSVARGDALVGMARRCAPAHVLDAALTLREAPGRSATARAGPSRDPRRSGRLVALSDRYWQLRLERPLLVANGDRLVIRRIAPPDTLGGGIVLDSAAKRHGRRPETLARLARIEAGDEPDPPRPQPPEPGADPGSIASTTIPPRLAPGAVALAASDCSPRPRAARAARSWATTRFICKRCATAGTAVRVGRDMYAHADAVAAVRERVVAIIGAEGQITLARLRDELHTSRKFAQALLEHLDAARVTRRRPDDSRVLRRS